MNAKASMLRAPDVCCILGISAPTLYRWIRCGRFPRGIKYGFAAAVGWKRATVDAWLAEQLAFCGLSGPEAAPAPKP